MDEITAKEWLRRRGRYLVDNLPIQIVLVVTLLALMLVLAIPFLVAQIPTDPTQDQWDNRVTVMVKELGTLTRTTIDSNGREVFNVISRRYNARFMEEPDNSRVRFHTPLNFVPQTENVYKNGVRQVSEINYTLLYEGPIDRAVGIRFGQGSVPQVSADGNIDILIIDYDPVQ